MGILIVAAIATAVGFVLILLIDILMRIWEVLV